MYAKLGDIKFDVMPITGIDESSVSNYAEHAVIEGKPKLQYVGESLDEINIRAKFHFSFCLPAEEIEKLTLAKVKHEALDFIYGNGKRVGKFVIVQVDKTYIQNDNLGNIMSIEVNIKLKEYAEPEKLNPSTGKRQAPKPPVLSTAIKAKPFLPDPVKVSEIRTRIKEKIENDENAVVVAITRKDWLDEGLKTGVAV